MKIRSVGFVCLFVLIVTGCTTPPKTAPFLDQHTYTTLDGTGSPLLSVNGVSEDWIIYTSHLETGSITSSWSTVDDNGSPSGSVGFRAGLGELNNPMSNIRRSYFSYDLLVNQNYEQQAKFIKATQYHEVARREVGYRDVILESVQFRDLQCMLRLSARRSTPNMGYILEKSISCPVVIDNKMGSFGFTLTITNWRATLEDLQEKYGDDYLRLVLGEVGEIIESTIESLVFHVDVSQSPDSLMDFDFPPVPEGMTHTDFYLEIIPKQFHRLSLPYVERRERVLVPADVERMKSKGLTLSMARQWKVFFERTRDAYEALLREPSVIGRTEEGIQMRLRDASQGDLARLFREVVEMWNDVP